MIVAENLGFFFQEKGKQPTSTRYNWSESLPRELPCEWQLGGLTFFAQIIKNAPWHRNFSSDILRNFSNPRKSHSVLLCVSPLSKSRTLHCVFRLLVPQLSNASSIKRCDQVINQLELIVQLYSMCVLYLSGLLLGLSTFSISVD